MSRKGTIIIYTYFNKSKFETRPLSKILKHNKVFSYILEVKMINNTIEFRFNELDELIKFYDKLEEHLTENKIVIKKWILKTKNEN